MALLSHGAGVCDKFLPHFIEMKCSMALQNGDSIRQGDWSLDKG
jgi:hypothetical protein